MASTRRSPSKFKSDVKSSRASFSTVKADPADTNRNRNSREGNRKSGEQYLLPARSKAPGAALPGVSIAAMNSEVRRSQLGAQLVEDAVGSLNNAVQTMQSFEDQNAFRADRTQQHNEKWHERFALQQKLNDKLQERIGDIERRHELVLGIVDSHIQKCELQEERKRLEDLIREEREQRRNLDQQMQQEYGAMRELMREEASVEEKIKRDISILDYQLEYKGKYASSPRTRFSQLPQIPLSSRAGEVTFSEEQLLANEISRLDGVIEKYSRNTQKGTPVGTFPRSHSPYANVDNETLTRESGVLKELHNLDELLGWHRQAANNLPEKANRTNAPVPFSKLVPRKTDWLTYYQLHQKHDDDSSIPHPRSICFIPNTDLKVWPFPNTRQLLNFAFF